jgi:hypothetical protein
MDNLTDVAFYIDPQNQAVSPIGKQTKLGSPPFPYPPPQNSPTPPRFEAASETGLQKDAPDEVL